MQHSPLRAIFYKTKAGNEPVRAWLSSLSKGQKKAIGQAIRDVQNGWPIGMPLVRKMKKSLWEVRVDIPTNEIARVLFTIAKDPLSMVLLHGFVKKSQKTPQVDLDTAEKRMKQHE